MIEPVHNRSRIEPPKYIVSFAEIEAQPAQALFSFSDSFATTCRWPTKRKSLARSAAGQSG